MKNGIVRLASPLPLRWRLSHLPWQPRPPWSLCFVSQLPLPQPLHRCFLSPLLMPLMQFRLSRPSPRLRPQLPLVMLLLSLLHAAVVALASLLARRLLGRWLRPLAC